MRVTIYEQKNLEAVVANDLTQNPLNESSMSNHEISRPSGLLCICRDVYFFSENNYWLSEIWYVARIITCLAFR
jgi:hypothetical protein